MATLTFVRTPQYFYGLVLQTSLVVQSIIDFLFHYKGVSMSELLWSLLIPQETIPQHHLHPHLKFLPLCKVCSFPLPGGSSWQQEVSAGCQEEVLTHKGKRGLVNGELAGQWALPHAAMWPWRIFILQEGEEVQYLVILLGTHCLFLYSFQLSGVEWKIMQNLTQPLLCRKRMVFMSFILWGGGWAVRFVVCFFFGSRRFTKVSQAGIW